MLQKARKGKAQRFKIKIIKTDEILFVSQARGSVVEKKSRMLMR
jgi:hypothetical protein